MRVIRKNKKTIKTGVLSLFLLFYSSQGLSQSPPVSSEPSNIITKSLLLDIEHIGSGLIAVGDRGHVVRSNDCGQSWKQIIVPTRATLNAVFFVNKKTGWIAGHDSVILKTTDSGKTWKEVYKDIKAEQPLFDVLFVTENKGFAIGAYGSFLKTENGGKTWEASTIYGEDDFHLYRISRSADGELLVTGEAGAIYLSTNNGDSWDKIKSPYEGTFFGNQFLAENKILIYGMRGHVYESDDLGQNWKQRTIPVNTSLESSITTEQGITFLVGASGAVLKSPDNAKTFKKIQQSNKSHRVAITQCGEKILTVGEKGILQVNE